ncbi:MAG: hypothetical protein GY857_09625 [Desulfobacula sp.]|nr:hypothetical protein [Desulfobacula sp.]
MSNTTISKMVEPLKTGELLVKEGLINLGDIDLALSIQKEKKQSLNLNRPRLIGMILCNLNLITPKDNYYVLHKYNKLISIQSALIESSILSKDLVLKTDNKSQKQDIPFISCLLKQGLVSTTKMQQLLFDLFHIPFRSISDFVFSQKDKKQLIHVLDKDNSRENRIIPLVLKDNTILFGITDPQNILFIGRLNDQFPQYRFKTLFIPFSDYLNVSKIIYDSTITQAPLSREKSLDLSLLLSFKTSINSPETELESIETLYERYELLRLLSGNLKRKNYLTEFNNFITHSHKTIAGKYKNQNIEFSLKKNGRSVKIIAFPL